MAANIGGTLSLQNFKEYSPDLQAYQIDEYPLFTDADVIGELREGCEPYTFLNMVPIHKDRGIAYASIMLRIYWFTSYQIDCQIETDNSKYHGGGISDEIAALASLKLGIRLKAGGMTRSFHGFYEDGLGRPHPSYDPIPQLIVRNKRRLMLPNVVKSVDLAALADLKSLRNISEDRYISLLRSARLYQDAIWIAENDPNLAWLMLISAVETAANQWSADLDSPSERLKSSKPKVAELLMNSGGEELLRQVADQIAPSLGSTNKFIKFCLEYMPDPPGERPKHAQVEWTKNYFRKEILNKLYEYRSCALHGGTPFPAPMCMAPYLIDGIVSERVCPYGLSATSQGATWKVSDLPINMNTFNYFVNGVLNKWWSSFVDEDNKIEG
jgi:hypothetical protein